MTRVPEDISLEWLLGQTGETERDAPALQKLSDKEVQRFIGQCSAALKSHDSDYERLHDKENALAVFEGVLAVLLEVRDIYPGKRADIDVILMRFGYPVPEN